MTTTTSSTPSRASLKTSLDEVRLAQKAMRLATRGEVAEVKAAPVPKAKVVPASPVLDSTVRESMIFRAVSLLSTMTEYYGITVGELEDEKVRLRSMSDQKLVATTTAYEFASKHVDVMMSDEKAREAAIAKDPKTAEFYGQHGVGEDELIDADRKAKSVHRRMQRA